MELKQFTRHRKFIKFVGLFNSDSETEAQEERKVQAKEAPLPELDKALDTLKPVFNKIIEGGDGWTTGLTVTQITISRTKHGTRSVSLRGQKALDVIGGHLHTFDTPLVRIDKPADGESGSVELDKKEIKLICGAIGECERYAQGQRSQQLLDLDDGTDLVDQETGEGLFK